MTLRKQMACECAGQGSLFGDSKGPNATLSRMVTANGDSLVHWRCRCGRALKSPLGGLWIPHDAVRAFGVVVEELPLASSEASAVLCQRCQAVGAEAHHWAPRRIFGDDCDEWPTSFLCRRCHREWHDRTGV